ncbi:helix-turn-helix domain-containing protein [Pontibacter sp. E15-1]|uniref:helix-turn-helix domain-containing protein n=1 Tax=Pontibacter sp. E15-1 TaxID=2919918 RepID=UPI001F4F97DA|nr:helix-turn-helix transcriptional regulator [Pontibacter sp. E15-1]MCJ8166009.1 helix-turn-helix domain-containing protein [Pontibacter sp. E15-1]
MERDSTDLRLRAIGERIRQLRVERGYSSYENFAFDNGLPRVGYGRHEKGANLTMASLLRILDIHGVTLREFFSGLDI